MFNIYDYEVLEKFYENADGVVFIAKHKNQGSKVFLKKLNSLVESEGNSILRERKIFKNASFQYLLPFSFLENESNPLLAVKEFPELDSLDGLLKNGDIDLHQKNQLTLIVLDIISTLHEKGLICLDVQPSNILAHKTLNKVYFIDGSSVVEIDQISIKRGNRSILSPYYQSPELTGRIATIPDQRSDYFSFGVFLYELYCGRKPFFDSHAENILYLQLTQIPIEPTLIQEKVGKGLSDIIMKLLDKNPDNRYATVGGIIHDLEQAFHLMENSDYKTGFALGDYDLPENLALSEELIGKDSAFHLLTECVDILQTGGNSQFIDIQGEKGIGKSKLIAAFEKYLSKNNLVYVKGSFINDHQIPYSGIREACLQLIRILLSLPEDQLGIIREDIINKGGPALNILQDFLPEFSSLIALDSSQSLNDLSSKNQSLIYAISIFLSAIAVHQKHLIIIWEDFESAQSLSLKLIDSLYYQESFKHVMVIGLSRMQNVRNELFDKIKSIGDLSGEKYFSIELKPLSTGDIENWLIQSHFQSDICIELAKKIHQETQGVPSAILELLGQLYQNHSIIKAPSGNWSIDSSGIQSIELKRDTNEERDRKLKRLSGHELKLVEISVFLISPFSASLLQEISCISEPDFESTFMALQKNKFLRKASFLTTKEPVFECSDPTFTQYLKSVISPEKAEEIYFSMASVLERNSGNKTTQLYELLSIVLKLPAPKALPFKKALYDGALAATREAAFQTALNYQLKLIEAFTEDYWNKDPEACFDLYFKAAETAIWALDDIQYEHLLKTLKSKGETTYKITRICSLEMQYATKQGRFNEVIESGCKALRNVNIHISTQPNLGTIISALIKVSIKMGRKTIEDIEKIHSASDPDSIILLRILENMVPAIFLGKPEMLPEVMSVQIRKALQLGFSDSIGIAFMSYAFILSSFNPDYKKALEVSNISFFLHKKFNSPYPLVTSNFVYGVFVMHWFYPLRECKKLLEENYLLGRQVGNINLAFYSLALSEICNLFLGTSLKEVLERSNQFNQFAINQREKLSREFFHLLGSFCEELREPVFREKAFIGKHNEIEEIFERQKKANNYSSVLLIELFRNLIELLNEHYEGGDSYLQHLKDSTKIIGKGSYQLSIGHFIGGLKLTRKPEALSKSQDDLVKYAIQFLKTCFKQIPANHAAKYYGLLASYTRRLGKYEEALIYINQAIDSSTENNLIIEEALSWEEKYAIQSCMKNFNAAQESLKCAYLVFEKWGVISKLAKLRQQQSIIFIDKNQVYTEDKDNYFQLQGNPDISNLIKASNSIAGEIKLDQLLEKMFLILAETAGAQNIYLLVQEEAQLKMYSHKSDSETGKIIMRTAEEKELPLSIINYVRRSREVILINDISNESLFKKDPYFAKKEKASVLCLPLIKNRDLLGIVYMENEITQGAFTEERLGLIKLLSTQMAISLENALLYENMELKVKFRTEQLSIEKERTEERSAEISRQKEALEEVLKNLKSTQNQLIQSEKMASLGELTAGIAHEIQNPLNFVNNFSEVNNELIVEIKEELENGNIEEALLIAENIAENEQKINFHGKRADAIVKGMLLHSRMSNGQKEPTNLNILADEYFRLAFHGLKAKDKSFNSHLVNEFDSNIGLIDLNPQDMGRAILNLITNAFYTVTEKKEKSGKDYEPTVTVGTRLKSGSVELFVKDNGNGIPKEILDKIFQPFFTTKPTGQGTGLGLSLTYDIVKSQGGELRVESEEGIGSTFTIKIPI